MMLQPSCFEPSLDVIGKHDEKASNSRNQEAFRLAIFSKSTSFQISFLNKSTSLLLIHQNLNHSPVGSQFRQYSALPVGSLVLMPGGKHPRLLILIIFFIPHGFIIPNLNEGAALVSNQPSNP